MDEERTLLEVIAPSVEEAIDKGLTELGLQVEDVDVEILDEGKRNMFKFTSRQARIRLKVKANFNGDLIEPIEVAIKEHVPEVEENFSEMLDATETKLDETLQTASEIIQELLSRMGIKAEIQVEYGEKDKKQVTPILVNIEGDDLSFLIGRQSETINALQYLASLMVGNKLNRWIPLQIDVQNFRVRRERALRKIARRMAEQVLTSGRKQYLEPMPANERRIIHLELRDHPSVKTESTGEEPYRKVTISLKD